MTLSIMERLELGKELSELMQAQKTASVMQRMTIGKKIVDVMLKLGLGAVSQPALDPTPEPQPEEEIPQLVKDFLAGGFVKVSQMDFIDKLRAISGYVGQYLTLEQAKEQTSNWVSQSGYAN